MEILSTVHKLNIIVHVTAGSLALMVGLVAIVVNKNSRLHRRAGQVFLWLMSIVILTGLIGVFVFGRNTFLLVITVMSGYLAFSGYRAIRLKSNRFNLINLFVSLAALATVSYFLYYFKSVGMIWSPVIIYSTVGYLFFIVGYDLLRYIISSKVYGSLWMHEHILKMVSAFTGLLSAFSGTVFPQYQPYSQFLPSISGTLVAIGFMLAVARKSRLNLSAKA